MQTQCLKTGWKLLRLVMLFLLVQGANNAPGQTYTILHSFGTNVMGKYPEGPLVQAPDGTLYGATVNGGLFDLGQVFKVNSDGTGYQALKDFGGLDGVCPYGGVVLSGTTLYGTTSVGGSNDCGTIFKLQTDGTGFQVLKHLSLEEGAESEAALAISGTTLYGTTTQGGGGSLGTVFKVQTDGTDFQLLAEFGGPNGSRPRAAVIVDNGTLYGTTSDGGSNSCGTVFRINADGTGFQTLHSFSGWGAGDGAEPWAPLTLSGTTLYGEASEGGPYERGTVFKLQTDGTGFVVIKCIKDAEGQGPRGGLLLSDNSLYGVTRQGGAKGGHGTVFKMKTDGSEFQVLKTMTPADGSYPTGLVLSNKTLYGTTSEEGENCCGTVFRLETDGSDFAVVLNFQAGDSSCPEGGLLVAGCIYGVTAAGGKSDRGTIYQINPDGTGYKVLHEFTGPNEGFSPNGGLTIAGDMLYGTTFGGGLNNSGTLFKLSTNGTGFVTLKHFEEAAGEAYPRGGLLYFGTNLYGATSHSSQAGAGVLFRLSTDGSDYAVIKRFFYTNGAEPNGGLVSVGNAIYGSTPYGGSNGVGTVFRINADGSGHTILKHFARGDGAYPEGTLVLGGTTLYGTAREGGSSFGTLFKINLDGSGFAVLKSLLRFEGEQPYGGLALEGSTLYGSSRAGGLNGVGTVFQIGTDGSRFSTLKHFDGPIDFWSDHGVAFLGGALYGTADGGDVGGGALFRLSPGPPSIVLQPESQTNAPGATVAFPAGATGWPAPVYQWYFNGTIEMPGATASVLSLTNLQLSDVGAYTLIASNSFGSVTSQVAVLTLMDPFIGSHPVDLNRNAGDTAIFSVTTAGTLPLSYQWFKNAGVVSDIPRVTGSQTSVLTISNTSAADAGDYFVVATNVLGAVTSRVATLTVVEPYIRTHPTNVWVNAGQNAVFSAAAAGTTPLTYRWLKDGVWVTDGDRVTGSQTTVLTVNSAAAVDAGGYSVAVSNAWGSVTSAVANLMVNLALTADFGSRPGPNWAVTCFAETAAGDILIGGGFSQVQGLNRRGLALLSADGTVNPSFVPALDPNAEINGVAVLPDGRILVVGNFTTGNGGSPRYLCRVTSGGLPDTTFDTGANAAIACVAVQPDGKVIVGSGQPCFAAASRTVVRLNPDGTLDSDFTAAPDGGVHCLKIQPDGRILIAGGFGNVNGQPRNRVARLNVDGTLDATFVPPPNPFSGLHGSAYSLALQTDGKVLVGGWSIFGEGNQVRQNLARLNADGTLDMGFRPQVPGGVFGIFVQSEGDILLGGEFNFVSGLRRQNIARLRSDGTIDPLFDPGANAQVWAFLEQADGSILVGGYFTSLAGQPCANLGRLVLLEPPHPVVLPAAQTVESGTPLHLVALDPGKPAPVWQWYLAGEPLNGATNSSFRLAAATLDSGGVYGVVGSNIAGVSTSAPAIVNVIAQVDRRAVPGLTLAAEEGTSVQLDFRDDLTATPAWLLLDTVSLTDPPQWYFDLSSPLPPRRFYRAWQAGAGAAPVLALPGMVPALTLTGPAGSQVRVDGINRVGPVDAWFTLDTVTLTNTSQLYFDVTAPGQPARLYRLVPVP